MKKYNTIIFGAGAWGTTIANLIANNLNKEIILWCHESEVAQNIGFITVHSDKPANVYVDDRKVGFTPVIKAEVMPGAHRVLAVEVETGKRKAVTADVERGAERRVRFAFQPVQ